VKILKNLTTSIVSTCLIAIFLISAPSLGYLSAAHADTASPPLVAGSQMAANAQVNTAGPMPELSWTVGRQYPVINGQRVPPPTAPPLNGVSPTTTGGHWWVGSVYPTTNTHLATWMWTEISIPKKVPASSEFYYVLLSAWDIAGSYDQVGFSDCHGVFDKCAVGVWGLTYSYTTGKCAATYIYSADAMSLTAGQKYAFFLTTVNGPGTWAEAYAVSSKGALTLVWSLHMPTGSSNPGLTVLKTYCGDEDYTDYQETYGTYSPPHYGASYGLTFTFTVNEWGTGTTGPPWTATSWVAFNSGNNPSFVQATISGSKVTVKN